MICTNQRWHASMGCTICAASPRPRAPTVITALPCPRDSASVPSVSSKYLNISRRASTTTMAAHNYPDRRGTATPGSTTPDDFSSSTDFPPFGNPGGGANLTPQTVSVSPPTSGEGQAPTDNRSGKDDGPSSCLINLLISFPVSSFEMVQKGDSPGKIPCILLDPFAYCRAVSIPPRPPRARALPAPPGEHVFRLPICVTSTHMSPAQRSWTPELHVSE